MSDKRRLIEVAFPLKQASLASVHEKNVRYGHISTLHIWPARRPLAASRAALLATLLADPEDSTKRRELLDLIGGNVVKKRIKETNLDGKTIEEDKEFVEGGVLAWGREGAAEMEDMRRLVREYYGKTPPKVLDPFAGGGAIPLEAMRLGCDVTASDLNPVAWLILKCTLDYPQKFTDKKWPLPSFVRQWPEFVEDFLAGKAKKRRGRKKSHFSEPRQLQLIDLPDADISWHARAWGRWILERSRVDLAARYPVLDGQPTVAYLWARTGRDKLSAGRVPLLKTFWLCKKPGRRAALLPIPNEDKSGVKFQLLREAEIDNPAALIAQHPFLTVWEVTPDSFDDFLKSGTMNKAGVWSPLTGRPGIVALTMEDLRQQGLQGLLGTQMTTVVVETKSTSGKKTSKKYRLPTEAELTAADIQIEDLEDSFHDIPFGIPNEPLPPAGTLGFRVPLYGFKKWRDMFTARQLVALATFVRHTRHALNQVKKESPDIYVGIAGILTLFFGRFVDYMSVLSLWEPDNGEVKHTFARYAFPITWDFAEANPLTESDRYYSGGIDVASRVITHLLNAMKSCPSRPHVLLQSCLSLECEPQQLILTDPPYYNAIPYSDLMDFFFIWQKRLLAGIDEEFSEAFNRALTPKWDEASQDGELIQDESRHGGDKDRAKKAYEDGMAAAFARCRRLLSDDGRFVAVFANKTVEAWETLVAAMIRSGFVVTASWPIQTEMPNKVTQKRANLSSSVWIVCRKRPMEAMAGWEERVTERMKEILYSPRADLADRNILQYYFDLGIRGPDLIWAALGPALEAYSAHPIVKKTAGGVMTVPEFLKEVRKLVLQFSLGELPGFRDVQQETQGRGETLELDPITQYYLLHRAYFGLEPAPAGACILYANACGKNETELKVVWNVLEQGGKTKRGRPKNNGIEPNPEDETSIEEGSGNEYRLLSWEERTTREELADSRNGQLAPLIDRLHRLMFLFQQNHVSEVQHLYESWGLSNERAFKPLLQAVRELALRDKNHTERRIVEALATQLRMNRKTVIVANEPVEVPLFTDSGEAIVGMPHVQVDKE